MLLKRISFIVGIILLVCINSAASTKCTIETAKTSCPSDYSCCSKYGFCGNTEEHCSLKFGCLFGCWNSSSVPSPTKKTVVGPSANFKPRSIDTESKIKGYSNVNGVDKEPVNPNEYSKVPQTEKELKERYSKRIFYGCISPQSIALTFDDGPSYFTDGILDVLRDYGVKGSFFIIGSNINSSSVRATVKRIVSEGHLLGSHTWSHPDLTTLSESEIIAEMNKTADAIYAVAGNNVFFNSIFRRIPKIYETSIWFD